MRAITPALLATITVALGPATVASAAPGDLDPAFSRDGFAETTFGELAGADQSFLRAESQAFAVGDDGRIVVAGTATYHIVGCVNQEWSFVFCDRPYGPAAEVLRGDGTPDPSFAGDGRLELPGGYPRDGPLTQGTIADVAIQADGKIVLAGGVGNQRFWAARLNRDGTPDTGFGSGGAVTVDLGPHPDQATSVAIQPDGRIVLAGAAQNGDSDFDYDAALVRLDPDGSLDPSFAGDGILTEDLSANLSPDALSDVALRPSGEIVGAAAVGHERGPAPPSSEVVEVDGAGDPVAGFGNGGEVDLGPPADYYDGPRLALDSQGRTVVLLGTAADRTVAHLGLARLTATGALDPSFSGDGRADLSPPGDRSDPAFGPRFDGLAIDASDRPVVSGAVDTIVVGRLTVAGAPDTSFSGDGWARNFRRRRFLAGGSYSVAIAPDGSLFAAGSAYPQPIITHYLVGAGPADADADGALDSADRCPLVYGCPTLKRRVRAAYNRVHGVARIHGSIRSDYLNCRNGVRVRLRRRRPGPDPGAGTARSNGYGFFRLDADVTAGRYYAIVPRRHAGPGICRRARSHAIKIR